MITLKEVQKSYGDFHAVRPLSLDVKQGEIFGVIGESGAGKSTLLRLMNRLEDPDAGEVIVNDESLTSLKGKALRQARRQIAMIFQHYHLVGNKTVFENVAVPLEIAGVQKGERVVRVMESIRFVGLERYVDQYPAQLSGGQKQRVAIARALANNPTVLLCDEPTSSLDPSTTAEILRVLQSINERLGVTIIIVSHEMAVIKSVCSRVAVMDDGALHEVVTIEPTGVQDVDRTADGFVKRLTGGGADA